MLRGHRGRLTQAAAARVSSGCARCARTPVIGESYWLVVRYPASTCSIGSPGQSCRPRCLHPCMAASCASRCEPGKGGLVTANAAVSDSPQQRTEARFEADAIPYMRQMFPAALPADARPVRRRGSHPGDLRPGLPEVPSVHARHQPAGVAVLHHVPHVLQQLPQARAAGRPRCWRLTSTARRRRAGRARRRRRGRPRPRRSMASATPRVMRALGELPAQFKTVALPGRHPGLPVQRDSRASWARRSAR